MQPGPLSIFLTTVVLFGALSVAANAAGASSLTATVSELYSEDNHDLFSSCDFKNRKSILQIARVLDAKEKEIIQYSESKAVTANSGAFEPFGDFHFQKPSVASPKSEWVQYSNSWTKIFTDFSSIHKKSVDQQWINFNKHVRGQVFDDDFRLGSGKFMGIHRRSEPIVQSIRVKLNHCVSHQSCTDPKLSKEQSAFLQSSRLYFEYLKRFKSAYVSDERKRIELKTFHRLFSEQARLFGVNRNPTIRAEGRTLVVPLDISVFGSGIDKVIAWIEREWNIDPDYKIRIQPVAQTAEVYKVLVDEKGGGRAFVNSKTKTIELQNYGSMKSIAHEFGHVLGFADTYFTTWDSVGCKYWIEWNPGDLMSGSSTGAVLPSHWDQLKKTYWNEKIEESKPQRNGL